MPLVRSLAGLVGAQAALRGRFDEVRRTLERGELVACRVALADFHARLRRWTEAEEGALLPAVLRAGVAGRDPRRELRLEWMQLTELSRYLLAQVVEGAPASDLAGLMVNLDRRLTAHEAQLDRFYFPAAVAGLTAEEWQRLEMGAPG